MLSLLLDECISPKICRPLWEDGIDVAHVRDRNMLGATDYEVLWRATEERRALVTINEIDFRKLYGKLVARNSPHCGLIVIPSGAPPTGQLHYIRTAVTYVRAKTFEDFALGNRFLRVNENGSCEAPELLADP